MPAVEDTVNKMSKNSNDFSEGSWYVKMEQLYKNEREDTHRKKRKKTEGWKSRHLLEDMTHID